MIIFRILYVRRIFIAEPGSCSGGSLVGDAGSIGSARGHAVWIDNRLVGGRNRLRSNRLRTITVTGAAGRRRICNCKRGSRDEAG